MRLLLDGLDTWWEDPRIFGVALELIGSAANERVPKASTGVPLFLEEWLERLAGTGGRMAQGCFRIPGHTGDVDILKRHYERDTVSELDWGALFTKGASCHEWASLLKLWLRELAEPIIPSSLYDRAVSIGRDSGKGGRAGALDEGAGLGHFMQQMSPTGAAVISRIATFLSTMDVSHTHMPVENLAMVFTPCLLRHTDMLVFMKNKDYEIEFTRRLLQYAAASGPTPALASQERPRALSWEHRAPQDDVVPLSPAPSDPAVDLAPAAAAATSSSTSAGGDDGQQRQQLSVLRRERSLESMAAARTALSSERTSRRVAEAEAVAQHVEVQKLTAELDATVSLIETLSDASAQQGGGGGGPPTTATGEELGQTSQRLQPAEPLSTAAEPQADPEVAAVSARALWAFEASGEGQLSVGVGQIVDVQQAPADSEWWLCSLGGEAGWLPVAYLEVIKSEFVSFGTLDLSLAG